MSTIFDVKALSDGDMDQLDLFIKADGKHRSFYIHWVPDEVTEDFVKQWFSTNIGLGKVTSVDFVKRKTGKDRMMFVHFAEGFYANINGENTLAMYMVANYPNAYDLPVALQPYDTQDKWCYLQCRINLNAPPPVVEYNTLQLTGMVDRLRKELEDVKEQMSQLLKQQTA